MPFPASSFDAVVNIESSHCYESMDTFLSEVCRVLRPGGRFFFADLRSMDGVNTLREQFNACDLTVEKKIDITTNVLTALRLDNARKLELIDALIPRVFHRPFRVFAGIAGTRNYAGLESGKIALPQRTAGKEQSGTRLMTMNPDPAPQEGRDRATGWIRSHCGVPCGQVGGSLDLASRGRPLPGVTERRGKL